MFLHWRAFQSSSTEVETVSLLCSCAEFTREVTDTQMPLVAPVILPEMYKIFTMAEVRHNYTSASYSIAHEAFFHYSVPSPYHGSTFPVLLFH